MSVKISPVGMGAPVARVPQERSFAPVGQGLVVRRVKVRWITAHLSHAKMEVVVCRTDLLPTPATV